MSRYSFMLPVDVVQQLETEADQRLAEEKLQQAQEERREESANMAKKQAQEAELRNSKLVFPEEVPTGYVRVLPRIGELTDLLSKDSASLKVSDADVIARREKLLKRLLNLGPDRKFVLPLDDELLIHQHN